MGNFLITFADANAASEALRSGISPLFSTFAIVGAILCILVIVFGGYYYKTSAGQPERLARAKKTIRNAIIGLVFILGSGSLVAIMQNAYSSKPAQPVEITVQQPKEPESLGIGDVINEAIKHFIESIVQSVGQPIIDLLKTFTTATPLVAQNGSVFNVWVVVVALVDVLFIGVVALFGFRIMTASILGLGDMDLRSMLPQIILAFILANVSIFAIDAIITISNAMIHALLLGMSNDIIWVALGTLIASVASINIGILFFVAVAIILAVVLLIYYLQRLIVLYIGAVLSPLIVMLWLLPSFKDFAVAAAKTYVMTIFALFVHVLILMLAVSLFSGVAQGKENPFITSLLGIATLLVLINVNRTMNQLAIIGIGNQGLRKLGNTFVSGVSHMSNTIKQTSDPSVSVERNSSTVATTNRVPTTTPLATGETRLVSPKAAAEALTNKNSSRDVVVSGGTKSSLSVTEKPSSISNVTKGIKK